MDPPEIEIFPGVYMTDYRRPQNQPQDEAKSLTPEQYIKDLISRGMLDDEILKEEISKLELSIEALIKSNDILEKEPDEVCQEAFRENVIILEKQRDMLQRVKNLAGIREHPGVYI